MRAPVILWLQRAFRLRDNAALHRAVSLARERDAPLVVLHGLQPDHPLGSPRVNEFHMACALPTLAALEARGALARHVPASARSPLVESLCRYAREAEAVAVVADDPLAYVPAEDLALAARRLRDDGIALHAVEANLVVPSRSFGRLAYGAFSIRGHIHEQAAPRLRAPAFPAPRKLDGRGAPEPPGRAPGECAADMHNARAVSRAPWPLDLAAGEAAARRRLAAFTRGSLATYGERGDAVRNGHHSGLSQDLHFGLLSPADVARAVLEASVPEPRKRAFLEQLLVRRELAYNAARYLPTMRGTQALPAWARATLAEHEGDEREAVYTLRQFEEARTHDEVWNATQRELRHRGSIHSYMRMYWGKKILEWTRRPATALRVMETLNGQWALDGSDPNMWTGHLWCLGLHDRPFAERPVFGKVRWMSEAGVRRKFDVPAYVAWTDAGCPA